MNIGEIITVASGKDFLVLEILEINNDTYLYTVLLNKEEMPTNEYLVFKRIMENDDFYVEMVTDDQLLAKIKSKLIEKYGDIS